MATIHKLSADVVNRIAAGEVVQRPSAALKELLENAIDADCSRIQVLAAEGGLEVLQVSDDGSGIHKEDLPLLCERYATSKLHSFEDLHHVTSFGFRGEALASISYVSRVTVTTRRRPPPTAATASASTPASGSQVAWRAQYLNGSLTSDPQPCAGNVGTTIRAEKLFYNALVRRNSLRPSEEWGRIVDIVLRYALAYPQIGFTCQRDPRYNGGSGGASGAAGSCGSSGLQGGGGGGVNFPPNSTTRQNIRLAHGSHISSHLRLVYAYEVGNVDAGADASTTEIIRPLNEGETEEQGTSLPSSSLSGVHHQNAAQEACVFAQMGRRAHHVRSAVGPAGEGLFTLIGYTSDPTLAQRKPYLCLFINQRLVESTAIRKAIDSVYSGVLTGGNRPFTILFLTVPTDRLDVNVHPTKKEVFLLDEEFIVARVAEVCRGAVLEAAAARQMDMLKMRHTTALALKQIPAADGRGGVDSDAKNDVSGSSSQHILEKLRDQHRRGAPIASPLTSSSPTVASSTTTSGGCPAVVVAPCTVVRVEPQKGELDRYFSQRLAVTESNGKKDSGDGGVVREGAGTSTAGSPAIADPQKLKVRREVLPCGLGSTNVTVVSTVSIGTDTMDRSGTSQRAEIAVGEGEASPAYETPSWDAVMASLHRITGVSCDHADEQNKENRADAVQAGTPNMAAVPMAQFDSEQRCNVTSMSKTSVVNNTQAMESMQLPSHAGLVHVKGERGIKADKTMRDKHTSTSAVADNDKSEYDDDDVDEEEEEDRMREFKRHRRDVYQRVEELQKNAPTTIKEGEKISIDVKKERTANGTVLHNVETTANAADTSALSAVPTAAADLKAMTRLGAVVQASDLLRDEALAAAKDASSFAYVVSSREGSDDEEDTEEGKILDVGSSRGPSNEKTALVAVAEVAVPAVLSSVSIVVDRILAHTSPSAAALTAQLTYVGTIDARAFLAQVGTTLVWCDTMCLVRHVVFQRIFLRWGQPSLPAPPVLEFNVPLSLTDLLATALAFDAPHLQPPSAALLALGVNGDQDQANYSENNSQDKPLRPTSHITAAVQGMGGLSAAAWRQLLFQDPRTPVPTDSSDALPPSTNSLLPKPATRRYICRLVRRLCRWRGLLQEYFFMHITSDGLLISLPYGLNQHWPPLLRALPLTVWLLAEAVPYPDSHASLSTDLSLPLAALEPTTVRSEGEGTSTGTTPAPTQTLVESEADGVAQEVTCFTAVARHLADTLYGLQAPPAPDRLDAESSVNGSAGEVWREDLVQHGLFPCLKNAQLFRLPDQCLRDGTIRSMVSVESLYKVFERC